MIEERLRLGREMLSENGILALSIDQHEAAHIEIAASTLFPVKLGTIVVQTNPKGRGLDKYFATSHDYLMFFAKVREGVIRGIPKDEEDIAEEYPEEDEYGRFRYIELRNTHRQYNKGTRPNLWYPLYVEPNTAEVFLEPGPGRIEVFPVWDDGLEGCWTWGRELVAAQRHLLVGRCVRGKWKVFRKDCAHDEEGNVVTKKPKTIWLDGEFQTEKGQRDLDDVMGERLFWSPKPVELIKTAISLAASDVPYVLDFFAGSGTTGHAVIQLNREDGERRKFILVEMGEYVNTVLVRRLQKLMYAPEWENGRPKVEPKVESFADESTLPTWMQRSPRIVKILRLESYEDSLYNLSDVPSEREKALLRLSSRGAWRARPNEILPERNAYLLEYFAEAVTDGNPSLLRPVERSNGSMRVISEWVNPDIIRVKRPRHGTSEGVMEAAVDWIETAIMWLGLRPIRYEEVEANGRTYRILKAERSGERIAVVLRNAEGVDPEADRLFLETHLQGFRVIVNAPPTPAFEALEDALRQAMLEGSK